MKKRLIGLDYGTKRIGVALTDPLWLFAQPYGTFPTKEIIPVLRKLVSQEPIEAFVVGLPLTLEDEEGKTAKLVRSFVKKLAKEFPLIPIMLWDERYTSVRAQEWLIQAGAKKKKRQDKAQLDKMAAALILQEYLESLP